MEISITNDSSIKSLASIYKKTQGDIIDSILFYCFKHRVNFEKDDHGESVMFFIKEITGKDAIQTTLIIFGSTCDKVVELFNEITVEVTGICRDCSGNLIEKNIYSNDTIIDTITICEDCETKIE